MTSVTPPTKTSLLPVFELTPPAPRDLVPLPTTSLPARVGENAYDRAVAVIAATQQDIKKVTSRGALAPASRLDTWMSESSIMQGLWGPLGTALGALGGVGFGAALLTGTPLVVTAVAGAVSAIGGLFGHRVATAEKRLDQARNRREQARYGSQDVDAMSRRFIAAAPEIRALARPAFAGQLSSLQTWLKPTAVVHQENILAAVDPVPSEPMAARVAQLTNLVAQLLAGTPVDYCVAPIERLITDAPEHERRDMARALSTALFDSNEDQRFQGEAASAVQLCRAIQRAAQGLPPRDDGPRALPQPAGEA